MWMHLANRAFMSGASAHKGLSDNEGQGGMLEEPLVVLPARVDYDDVDDDVTETLHLINPSMNELMRAIHTANQRPIIVTQPRTQGNYQRGNRGFRAIQGDGYQGDPMAFARLMGGGQDRINYYPQFVGDICSHHVAPEYMPRALSFDDLHFVGADYDDDEDGSASLDGDTSSSSKSVLWRVHSEGALISMPGDGNLAKQMAILKHPSRRVSRHPRKKRRADLDNILAVDLDDNWGPGYWITMAHILMVIACHRWAP